MRLPLFLIFLFGFFHHQKHNSLIKNRWRRQPDDKECFWDWCYREEFCQQDEDGVLKFFQFGRRWPLSLDEYGTPVHKQAVWPRIFLATFSISSLEMEIG